MNLFLIFCRFSRKKGKAVSSAKKYLKPHEMRNITNNVSLI
ncbi:hypothetical protein RV11_GL001379 [Enterococcus phoeniculicola]|nr:hypothetical protein RV11_GL001379 [Enterococcus phoeniculicola]